MSVVRDIQPQYTIPVHVRDVVHSTNRIPAALLFVVGGTGGTGSMPALPLE
jgi:hypothetical protein